MQKKVEVTCLNNYTYGKKTKFSFTFTDGKRIFTSDSQGTEPLFLKRDLSKRLSERSEDYP